MNRGLLDASKDDLMLAAIFNTGVFVHFDSEKAKS